MSNWTRIGDLLPLEPRERRPMPKCPVCGNCANEFYSCGSGMSAMIVGCESCVSQIDAWEYCYDNE